jgi:hypothetical protein
VRKGSGKYVYKPGDKHPYEKKPCGFCGETKLMRRSGSFCSKSCTTSAHWRDGVDFNLPKGENNASWKGDQVSYAALHHRILVARGKASMCVNRPSFGCTSISFEWAHIHDTDPYNVENYVELCASCHRKYDVKRDGEYWRLGYR